MVFINPPPPDLCCECCGRDLEHVPPAPQTCDRAGQRIISKTFRDNGGGITASWECCVCLGMPDEEYWQMQSVHRYLDYAAWMEEHGITDETVTIEDIHNYIRDAEEKKGSETCNQLHSETFSLF